LHSPDFPCELDSLVVDALEEALALAGGGVLEELDDLFFEAASLSVSSFS